MVGNFFSRLGRLLLSLIFFLSSTATGFFGGGKQAEPSLEPPVWPLWVHQHWVWENIGTQESALELVQDYKDRDVPVGAVIIDRPWATDSNTFIPDPERYPDLGEYVGHFHDMDVRVIMWATSIVNETASNYQEGKDKGYFLSKGKTVKWWGGEGALLDYTNPEAVEWWHRQMDNILDMGIDGWKVDGTDPFVLLLAPALTHDNKLMTWAKYRDLCYRDFFEYSREKLGNDRVISARPVDDQLLNIGIPLVSTSRDINFAGWVGDQDNDWAGLRHALNNMFSSARFNFVSYGSDIGGFRSDGDMFKDVFIRWAQLGAFCPVMENGGGGEHRPWMFDEETMDIYRKFTVLHHELIPYIYSQAAYSYEIEKPTMRPQLGEYTYLLGEDILVAPFAEEGTKRKVRFPKGEWIYMFDESIQYSGGSKTLDIPLNEFPVFIRKGAIIPMEISCELTGFGTEFSKGYTSVLFYPEKGEKKFGLYEETQAGAMLSYKKDADSLQVSSSPTERSLLFRIYGEPQPESLAFEDGTSLIEVESLEELAMGDAGYYYDGSICWVGVKDVSSGTAVQINY